MKKRKWHVKCPYVDHMGRRQIYRFNVKAESRSDMMKVANKYLEKRIVGIFETKNIKFKSLGIAY